MTDARFEDGAEAPLKLKAQEADDLPVISALVQDAVFPITEMRFESRRRRFALLLNRFRWEHEAAGAARGGHERVQSVLVVEDVQGVATRGIDRTDRDTILSLLSLNFERGTDGGGRLVLVLAGDGAIALDVECLEVTLKDVTRPYRAPSGKAPRHPD